MKTSYFRAERKHRNNKKTNYVELRWLQFPFFCLLQRQKTNTQTKMYSPPQHSLACFRVASKSHKHRQTATNVATHQPMACVCVYILNYRTFTNSQKRVSPSNANGKMHRIERERASKSEYKENRSIVSYITRCLCVFVYFHPSSFL